MTGLQIEFEPLDIPAGDDPKIVNTMGRLEIRADSQSLTRVSDQRSRSLRDSAIVSAYPLAEWIAANWWSLRFEPETRSESDPLFLQRHSTAYAGDGFLYPDLRIIPRGDHFLCRWRRRAPGDVAAIEYVSEGEADIPADATLAALRDFVETVLARLVATGVADSWLDQEWTAIGDSESDLDELEFCRRAAELGLDPYDISDEQADEIQTVAGRLPASMHDEFFVAVPPDALGPATDWIEVARKLGTTAANGVVSDLRDTLRTELAAIRSPARPHERGYALAEAVRQSLKLDDSNVPVAELSFLESHLLPISGPPSRALDAVINVDSAQSTYACATSKPRPESQRFVSARGLAAFLLMENLESRLLTTTNTGFQQMTRAFAAELLVPADRLRRQIHGSISLDTISELAYDFGVSEYVVRHQIVNHRIASLEGLEELA